MSPDDKFPASRAIIQIMEIAPKQYAAQSILPDGLTSDILFMMAKQYLKQAVIAEHEEQKRREGGIVNPMTGMVFPNSSKN